MTYDIGRIYRRHADGSHPAKAGFLVLVVIYSVYFATDAENIPVNKRPNVPSVKMSNLYCIVVYSTIFAMCKCDGSWLATLCEAMGGLLS